VSPNPDTTIVASTGSLHQPHIRFINSSWRLEDKLPLLQSDGGFAGSGSTACRGWTPGPTSYVLEFWNCEEVRCARDIADDTKEPPCCDWLTGASAGGRGRALKRGTGHSGNDPLCSPRVICIAQPAGLQGPACQRA
jgi:hypothetical protein